MEKVIVIRYGELYLKGKNRAYFERLLIKNIKYKLKRFACEAEFGRSRYLIKNFSEDDVVDIVSELKTVFGIHSLSIADCVANDYESILKSVLAVMPINGTFRVNVHRGDKRYPLTSVALAAKLGEDILNANKNLQVNLHEPDNIIWVDVRENGTAYVYGQVIMCAGGMPVGSAGRGLLLLSGGIDSPVAGYMMAKRGLSFDAIHFHSYPYTGERAKEKVLELVSVMKKYCGKIRLFCVSVTAMQEAIHEKCTDSYMITILRRFMMRLAENIAKRFELGCLINGES